MPVQIRVLVLAAVTAAAIAAGCGEDDPAPRTPPDASPAPIACTRAGCSGGVAVGLRGVPPNAAAAEVCVDEQCEEVRQPGPEEVRVPLPSENRGDGPDERTVKATVEVRDASGTIVARGSARVRLNAIRPNGRRCAPTCWSGEAGVELRRSR